MRTKERYRGGKKKFHLSCRLLTLILSKSVFFLDLYFDIFYLKIGIIQIFIDSRINGRSGVPLEQKH
jgi:hypothetical protein